LKRREDNGTPRFEEMTPPGGREEGDTEKRP